MRNSEKQGEGERGGITLARANIALNVTARMAHIMASIAPDIMSGEQTSTLTFSVSKGCISCFDNSTREYYTGRK